MRIAGGTGRPRCGSRGYHSQWTGELSNAQINLDGQLKESSLYTVGGKAPDGSGSDGGSGGSDGNQGENPLG